MPDDHGVQDIQLGAAIRALRRRRLGRQADLAAAAGVSQSLVSAVERGHLDGVAIGTLRSVIGSLDARVELQVRWRGGALDRLLDERHASLVGRVIDILQAAGWAIRVEASYAHFGERGSVDVPAFHQSTGTLLVVEVKSELTSIETTLRKLDEKVRLARIPASEHGWHAERTARLIVLPATTAARRAVMRHGRVLDVALPIRGVVLRSWLNRPSSSVSGILFLADNTQAPGKHRRIAPHRVRIPRGCPRRA